jgi:hypothetical protein
MWARGWWCGRPTAAMDVVLPGADPLAATISVAERR